MSGAVFQRLLVAGVAIFVAGLIASGCGGSDAVVTVVKTETVAAAQESTATRSDEAWIDLVRRQADEVDDLSLDIMNGEVNPTDAVLRVTNLENEFDRAGLVGTSPCVQEVAAEWGTTLRRFTDAFAMLVGAIPEVAKAAAERFEQGPPVRERATAVLENLDACIEDLGGVGAGSGASASATDDGLTTAINTWVADAPAGEGESSNDGLVWLLHTHGRLNTSGWTISEKKSQGSVTAVKIRAKKDVPVYIEGEPRPDLGTELLYLTVAVEEVSGVPKVTAACGHNFGWNSSDASPSAAGVANTLC